jgi:hypothetical protein
MQDEGAHGSVDAGSNGSRFLERCVTDLINTHKHIISES